jgi:acyl-CoA synthetase (AMP-forming)/AMP-acid ligase II
MSLHRIIDEAVLHHASHPAVIEGAGTGEMNYARLEELSDRLRDRLMAMDLARGDRAGIYLRKSAESVAAIFGILKAGAAYVPVDSTAPVFSSTAIATQRSSLLSNVSKPLTARNSPGWAERSPG